MRNFFSFLSRFSDKKIICFDGGGVRTIASIVFLKKLERESGKKKKKKHEKEGTFCAATMQESTCNRYARALFNSSLD